MTSWSTVTRSTTGRVAVGLVGMFVATVAVVSAIGRIAGFGDVRTTLEGADPRWLILCALGQTAVFTGYAGALRRTIAAGDPDVVIGVGASLRLALAGFAATQVFAFGGVGGLALVYWALRRLGREPRQATIELIGLNTAIYLVFGLMAWVGAGVAMATGSAPVAMTLPWLLGMPLVLAVATWYTAPVRIERWTRGSRQGWRGAIGIGVAAAGWVRARLGAGRTIFAWAGLYWAGDVVSLLAALQAFGASPAIAAIVLAYASGYLVQAVPIPLVATAGVDAATAATLHAVGVPLDVALVAVVAHRLFAFWLPVIPGSAFALTLTGLAPRQDNTHCNGSSAARSSS